VSTRITLLGSFFIALVSACVDGAATSPENGSGGGGAGGGVSSCPATGVSKGPWSFAAEATRVKLRWEACSESTAPEVNFAPEAGGPGQTVAAKVTPVDVTETYKAAVPNTSPPDVAGRYYMHDATLEGLSEGTCYSYALVADPSRKGRFCTARKPGDDLSFMAIGDTNPWLNDNTVKTLAEVLPKKPDFTVHGGDVEYYSSGVETWAGWFLKMQPMLAAGAFYPAIGNHESEKPAEFVQYSERFFHDPGFDGSVYYRFNSGGVWFFSIDTEQSLLAGSPQGTWLAQKLADAAASPGYRFSVVYMHRPLITCGDSDDHPDWRAYVTPLFQQYGVSLVLQAHMHGYERFEMDGITWVTTGGGGGAIQNVNENDTRPGCDKRVVHGPWYHAMLFHLTAGQLKGQAIDPDGKVLDTFTRAVP